MIALSNKQARLFLLLKHGLLGKYKFSEKKGALDFIRQTGCIQFDPVDICGKNSELTLQSRVKNFSKNTLYELLYKDRKLFDYPDKNLSIIPIEDWPYFERYRKASRDNIKKYPEIKNFIKQVKSCIREKGAICSSDIDIKGDSYWQSAIHWSAGNKMSRSVLEHMYSTGELIIHHKKGTRKYYDLSPLYISEKILNTGEPLRSGFDHMKWRVLRRIGAVGLLWNRSSDAWLYIQGLNGGTRDEIFKSLMEEKKITEVSVEGLRDALYCKTEDIKLIESINKNPEFEPRCEFIAPLDCFIWDRKLIKALFNFEYTWEIYTPPEKRIYGVYVLPVLFGDKFIGRVEPVCDRKTKTLNVKNFWYEKDVKLTGNIKQALKDCVKRFAVFNDCKNITGRIITD